MKKKTARPGEPLLLYVAATTQVVSAVLVAEREEQGPEAIYPRSEERRVGKECKSWCRSRWSPYH